MPDFALSGVPNFAAAALSGYKAGQQQGQQARLDSALSGADLSRPETLLPVLKADPTTGAALIGAAGKLADAHREAAGRQALAGLILAHGKGGDPSTGAGVPTQPAANAAADVVAGGTGNVNAAPTEPNEVVVTGQRAPTSRWSPEEQAAIAADPESFLKIQENIGKLDANHLTAINDAADTQAAVATAASHLPYEQRRAYIKSQVPFLTAHGVSADQINAFDPTDANISALQTQSLGVKDALAQADKDRTYGLAQTREAREARQGDARIGLESQSVGISASNLALSRARFAREGKSGGSGVSAPGGILASPTSRAAYDALPAGTHYRAPDGSIRVK